MTELVERLRDEAREQKQGGAYPSTVSVMKEAADEIERLRVENKKLIEREVPKLCTVCWSVE